MNTFSLAIRNLRRNRRRSLATLLALAIGAAAVLLFGGYAADIRYGLLTNYVRGGGHLQVQHFLDEHAEHQVEGFFRGGFRLGRGRSTRPLAALVVSNILAVDLVSALNRVHGAHVQRNGEQLHADRAWRPDPSGQYPTVVVERDH